LEIVDLPSPGNQPVATIERVGEMNREQIERRVA
jgi:hypothetical protein